MSFNPKHGRILLPDRHQMSAVATIQGVLREQVPRIVGNDQRTDKQLGRVIGMMPRNVRGWRERAHGISAAALLALAQHLPEIRALVLALLNAQAELDPEAERLASQVAARVGEILDQRQQELHRQRVALESER